MRKKIAILIAILLVMTMSHKINWLADRILERQRRTHVSLGDIRRARRIDQNQLESKVGVLTSRLTPDISVELSIARKLGAASRKTTRTLRSGRTVRIGDGDGLIITSERLVFRDDGTLAFGTFTFQGSFQKDNTVGDQDAELQNDYFNIGSTTTRLGGIF